MLNEIDPIYFDHIHPSAKFYSFRYSKVNRKQFFVWGRKSWSFEIYPTVLGTNQTGRTTWPSGIYPKADRLVIIDSIRHQNVWEIEAEWLKFQALKQIKSGWRNFYLTLKGKKGSNLLSCESLAEPFVQHYNWRLQYSITCVRSGYPLDKLTKDILYLSNRILRMKFFL